MEFEKKFVHCMWDESLVGKLCVFADDIPDLKQHVERCDPHYIAVLQAAIRNTDMDTLVYPFYKDANANTGYRFVYYDPNLECKIAHEQGKQIQFRSDNTDDTDDWVDAKEPTWSERLEYRIKPEPVFEVIKQDGVYKKVSCSLVPNFFSGTSEECDAWIVEHTPKTRRMTNRELVRWLAECKGERVDVVTKCVSVHYVYTEGYDNNACDEDIRIREWDSDEWHEPLVKVKE